MIQTPHFLLTHFIYPLEKPICLSKTLGIWLDNFREEREADARELAALKQLIQLGAHGNRQVSALAENQHEHDFPAVQQLPLTAPEGYLSLDEGLKKFEQEQSKQGNGGYIRYMLADYHFDRSDDYYEVLAKMWVILRFRSPAEKNPEEEGSPLFLWDECIHYSYLLSLLTSNESYYFGGTFALPELSTQLSQPPVFHQEVHQVVYSFCASNIAPITPDEYYMFSKQKPAFTNRAAQMEQVMLAGSQEKLLFMGALLRAADNSDVDPKYQLVTLVSILEMMLIREPGPVGEPGQEPELVWKGVLMRQLENEQLDIEKCQQELWDMYSQSLHIRYGRLDKHHAYVLRQQQVVDIPFPLTELIQQTYKYLRTGISEYTRNPGLISYLRSI